MPRIARVAPGGFVYHVFNRANGRLRLFRKEADFLAFEQVLLQAHQRRPIPILAWCIMSNHWHFVVRPRREGELSRFFGCPKKGSVRKKGRVRVGYRKVIMS